MTGEKAIRNGLVEQIDKPQGPSKTAGQLAEQLVAQQARGLKRLKRITIIAWAVTVLVLTGVGVVEVYLRAHMASAGLSRHQLSAILPEYLLLERMMYIVMEVLLVIACALLVALYSKSRTMTIRQIQTRLAGIEEQLKRIADQK